MTLSEKIALSYDAAELYRTTKTFVYSPVSEVFWVYEDELPAMSNDEYSKWFDKSMVIDGVRMGLPCSVQL